MLRPLVAATNCARAGKAGGLDIGMRIACGFKKILPSRFWSGRIEQSARAAEGRQRAGVPIPKFASYRGANF
jgi:tryptophanase